MAIEITAQPSEPKKSLDLSGLFAKKPATQDRIFFTEQLTLLIETGTSLHAALQVLSAMAVNPGLKLIIESLANDVEEGMSFSAACKKFPDFFSMAYVNLIAAAESGGFLDKVLAELQEMDEKREKLKATMVSALIYPVFLIIFSVAVVIFVLVAVFPKFADMFASIADDLPASTMALMAASHFLIEYWWLAVSITVAAVVGVSYWTHTVRGIAALDKFKMRAYGLKDIYIQLYLVQSLRLMGLSIGNGVSVMDTLDACKEVVENMIFNQFIARLQDNVREGAGFAIGFDQAEFIPVTVKHMIRTGEDTGNLSRVMGRVADYYERELEKQLAIFTRMVEPVMLLIMGGVVGLIVSSLILPIFKLSRAVG